MTPLATLAVARAALVLAAAAATAIASSAPASAVSLRVKLACASDYYAYCSQHAPESAGVRQCMRAHGPQLSQTCVSALVAAGEVSRETVEARVSVARN